MAKPEPVQLRRDPFARATLMRNLIAPEDRKPCAWCGNAEGKYQYHWEQDGDTRAHLYRDRTGFCSLSCCEAYNG